MLKCWTKKRNNGTTYKTCTRTARTTVRRKTKMPSKKKRSASFIRRRRGKAWLKRLKY